MPTVQTHAAILKLDSLNYRIKKRKSEKKTKNQTIKQRFPEVLHQLWKLFLQYIQIFNAHETMIRQSQIAMAFYSFRTKPGATHCLMFQWLVSNWNVGLPQVGFWTSHAKCAATAAQGNTMVFTPVTAARDSSRGASAETGLTSVNLALRWRPPPFFLYILL